MAIILPELTKTIRVPIKRFERYERKLGIAMRQQVFDRAMPPAARKVVTFLRKETIKRDIVWRKRYARGWRAETGNLASSVRVYNREYYGIVIEKGRRPNRTPPPVSALIPWVRDKLGLVGSEGRRAAFAIARNIGERGIAKRPVIGLKTVQKKILSIVAATTVERLQKAIKETRP